MSAKDISTLEKLDDWSSALTSALHRGAERALRENEKLARRSVSKKPRTLTGKKLSSLTDFILFSQREFLLGLSKDLVKGNISFSQFYLLSYLSTAREMTLRDVARKMGHSTAAATGLVDRMEKLGYVERAHAADDRRKVTLRITSRGTELVSRLRVALQDCVAKGIGDFETSDTDDLLASAGLLADSAARFLGGIEMQVCR